MNLKDSQKSESQIDQNISMMLAQASPPSKKKNSVGPTISSEIVPSEMNEILTGKGNKLNINFIHIILRFIAGKSREIGWKISKLIFQIFILVFSKADEASLTYSGRNRVIKCPNDLCRCKQAMAGFEESLLRIFCNGGCRLRRRKISKMKVCFLDMLFHFRIGLKPGAAVALQSGERKIWVPGDPTVFIQHMLNQGVARKLLAVGGGAESSV